MICRYCGKNIPDEASFCPFCGKRTESHLRAEDIESAEENFDYEYEEPKGKRRIKALISILAAVLFVVVAFIAVMVFVKPYLGEEPWPEEEQATEEESQAVEIGEPVKTMYVTAEEGLVMRSDPKQDADEIHIINYGQEIRVDKTESGWAHATADGVTGWCSEEYLSEEMPEVKPKEETELSEEDRGKLVEPSTRIKSGHHGVVDSEGGLNLRCGPGQEYDILLVIPHESEVVEEGREGDWIFVKYKGQYVWVNNEYIAPMEAD